LNTPLFSDREDFVEDIDDEGEEAAKESAMPQHKTVTMHITFTKTAMPEGEEESNIMLGVRLLTKLN